MSELFLINAAIDLNDFTEFKKGMQELIAIDKIEEDVFYKNEQIYNVNILNELYSNFGYEEQEISRFIEQELFLYEHIIENEHSAKKYCSANNFSFLGIDFSESDISEILQISNNEKYLAWIESTLSNFELFRKFFKSSIFNKKFESDFNSLSVKVNNVI